MFPRRTPLAEINVNVRTVIKGVESSAANHELPLPSAAAGHNTLSMFEKPVVVYEGDASIWALWRGTGTREDEKGDAPTEKGTLGLLVPFRMTFPLSN